MKHSILVINTGSSTTKTAIMENHQPLVQIEKTHSHEELRSFQHLKDEANFRQEIIRAFLEENQEISTSIAAIGAIGGILKPLQGGVYAITPPLVEDIVHGRTPARHASNIAALIAYNLGQKHQIPSYIVDPISTDELWDHARLTGLPMVERKSRTHALNVKACIRKAVKEHGKSPQGTFIVAHLGGGLTVNLVKDGKIVDIEDGRQYGPFSTEAAGGVPVADLLQTMMEKELDPRNLLKYWYGKGGFVAHLGINSIKDTLLMAKDGDARAQLVLDAFFYQIAKAIGALATASKGRVDCIILTGGAARSDVVVQQVSDYIASIAPILVFPGENELEAIAESVSLVLSKEMPVQEYK